MSDDWTFEYYPGEAEEELLFETRRPRTSRGRARPPRRPVRRPRPPVRLRPPVRFIFDQTAPEPVSRDFTVLLVRRNLSRQELLGVLRALDVNER